MDAMRISITDRYASAVRSSSLRAVSETHLERPESQITDLDVIGAMGLADKALTAGWRPTGPDGRGERVRPCPLAVPLQRLFTGCNGEAHKIVIILADMAFDHSFKLKLKINRTQATDMAQACLAWHRNGTCKPCGGHGKTLIPGTHTKSDHDCQPCQGTGRLLFEQQFKREHRDLARWLEAEMSRATGYAGPAAMRALAPSFNLE